MTCLFSVATLTTRISFIVDVGLFVSIFPIVVHFHVSRFVFCGFLFYLFMCVTDRGKSSNEPWLFN
jgi:hypothetical protein